MPNMLPDPPVGIPGRGASHISAFNVSDLHLARTEESFELDIVENGTSQNEDIDERERSPSSAQMSHRRQDQNPAGDYADNSVNHVHRCSHSLNSRSRAIPRALKRGSSSTSSSLASENSIVSIFSTSSNRHRPSSTSSSLTTLSDTDNLRSQGSFCRDLEGGTMIPGSKGQFYYFNDAEIPTQAHSRYLEITRIFCTAIEDTELKYRLDDINMRIKMAGRSRRDAKPSILISCAADIFKELKKILDKRSVKRHCDLNCICWCVRYGSPTVYTAATGNFDVSQWTKTSMCAELIEVHGRTATVALGVKIDDVLHYLTVNHIRPSASLGTEVFEDENEMFELTDTDCLDDESLLLSEDNIEFDARGNDHDIIWIDNSSFDDLDNGDYLSHDDIKHRHALYEPDISKIYCGSPEVLCSDEPRFVVDASEWPWASLDVNPLDSYLDGALLQPPESIECPNAIYLQNREEPIFVQTIAEDDPMQTPDVLVMSGIYGARSATLLQGYALLGGRGGRPFSQTRSLIFTDGKGVSKGESGSLVIEYGTWRIQGYIIASAADGEAFVMPFAPVFKRIKQQFSASTVMLPTPSSDVENTASHNASPNVHPGNTTLAASYDVSSLHIDLSDEISKRLLGPKKEYHVSQLPKTMIHPVSNSVEWNSLTALMFSAFALDRCLAKAVAYFDFTPRQQRSVQGWHQDLKPSNVLVVQRDDRLAFQLADLDITYFRQATTWGPAGKFCAMRMSFVNNFSCAGGNTLMILADAPAPAAKLKQEDPEDTHQTVFSGKSADLCQGNIQAMVKPNLPNTGETRGVIGGEPQNLPGLKAVATCSHRKCDGIKPSYRIPPLLGYLWLSEERFQPSSTSIQDSSILVAMPNRCEDASDNWYDESMSYGTAIHIATATGTEKNGYNHNSHIEELRNLSNASKSHIGGLKCRSSAFPSQPDVVSAHNPGDIGRKLRLSKPGGFEEEVHLSTMKTR